MVSFIMDEILTDGCPNLCPYTLHCQIPLTRCRRPDGLGVFLLQHLREIVE